jgi:type I restriction enzyme S subunit
MGILQPKLRFPEFEGDWEIKTLGSISSKPKYGLNSSAKEYDGINGYIRITDIDELSRKFLRKKITSPEEFDDTYLLQPNDLLFTRTGASTGKTYLYDEKDGRLFFAGFLIKFNITGANSKFIFYQTLLSKYDKWVKVMSMRSGQPGINAEEYCCWPLFLTTLPEQTKIGTFLSSIDEKINLLKEKKALLEAYKKGMMQKIFNKEIRFKDDNGNDFEDWEEKIFKEIFSFRSTNSLSRDKLNYSEGAVKNIHYGDIHTKFKTLFYLEKENVPFINNDVSIEKIPLDNYLKIGDLIIADASEDYDDIGKSIEIINLNNEKVLAGLHTFVARPCNNVLATGFLGYLMKSDNIKLQIKIMAQGTKVLSLSPTRFAEIKFSLPCLNEQAKIANFLLAIDEKIALVTTQMQDTQEYKKGLLQQMFV